MGKLTRREFLSKSGKAAAGVGLGTALTGALSTPLFAQQKGHSPNDKVLIACIGVGSMGRHNMMHWARMKDCEIVAVCDVDKRASAHAVNEVEKETGKKPRVFNDYRKLLEIDEIDAVSIGTPDHWHALPMIHACEAGKDCYVEKPISHNIVEGQAMLAAAKKFDNVIQVGTWQRSVPHYVQAQKFIQDGNIGKVTVVRAWTCGGAGMGKKAPVAPPAELDWDAYVGPAEFEPYRPNIHPHSFRWYFNYAAGLTGDWGVHMLDTVGTFMGDWHPQEVASYGGRLLMAPDDDRTTPDTQMAIYKYPDWILQWEIHVGQPGPLNSGHHGVEFMGTTGVVRIDRHGFQYYPKCKEEDKAEMQKKEEPYRKMETYPTDHWRNWIDCIKSREMPRSDIETMHYSTVMCHLANLAYMAGKGLSWDGKQGVVTNCKDSMDLLPYHREYRKPYELPRHDK